MPRLFVAVYPPAEVVDALARLPRHDGAGVRWVPPEQYHVTVRFLGRAEEDAVRSSLDRVAPSLRRETVVLGPRVSRLGRNVVCVPAAGLDALAALVATATGELGDPPDPRPFRGHVTLARLRARAACGLAGEPFRARFDADRVHLVDSVTRASGAEHTILRSWHLGA